MPSNDTYVPTEREQAFLDTIENPKYDRQIINGLKPFIEEKAPEEFVGFYSRDEIKALAATMAPNTSGLLLLALIDDASRYPEGRGFRIEVRIKKDVETVKCLAAVKMIS